jgi:signal transduction histidine kinase
LAYCRSTSHQDEREEVDLNDLLDRVLIDLQGSISKNEAKISLSPLPRLRVVPDQFAALLQNLIGNALRYRKPETAPEIAVSAHMNDDGFWEFTVSDNGIGVPVEFRTAIFEPFRRFNNPGADSGSGIGLALCRRVVEAHGGRIWVDETACGSAFRFTLP